MYPSNSLGLIDVDASTVSTPISGSVWFFPQSGDHLYSKKPDGTTKVFIQDGDPVAVSSGEVHVMSGVVTNSGVYVNLAASGVGISHYSGALNVNVSGGTVQTITVYNDPLLQTQTSLLLTQQGQQFQRPRQWGGQW